MKIFEFVNHACIKTEFNDMTLLTDPWVISNAFGGWYQMPSPRSQDILNIIDTDERMGVIVSHGHDDHCDDWFIKQHLDGKNLFYTEFGSPGLANRLQKSSKSSTTPIGEGVSFGDFKLRQFINPDFTEFDAVITIETPEFLIIHANDNWHEWPEVMLKDVSTVLKSYNSDQVFLLTQFGVADCFPVNYVGLSNSECQKILSKRFEKYLSATESNMRRLGLSTVYYYANQGNFNYRESDLSGQSMNCIASEFLREMGSNYCQLLPGMKIYTNHKVVIDKDINESIFDYCLSSLENFINANYRAITKNCDYISVKFLTPEDEITEGTICYKADIEVWNRILIGEINLEAITAGGCGLIAKPDVNIRDHHMFISKKAYIAQNMIRKDGLAFFRKHHAN